MVAVVVVDDDDANDDDDTMMTMNRYIDVDLMTLYSIFLFRVWHIFPIPSSFSQSVLFYQIH